MNAAHDNRLLRGHATATAAHGGGAAVEPGSDLSALIDGELEAHALDALLQSLADDESVRVVCQHYQVIGEVMRGGAPVSSSLPPHDFVAGVRARLQADSILMPQQAPAAVHVRAPAANDAVFRWKLLAGVASLAAVMAVSWNVLGGAPASSGGSVAGPQLALMPSLSGAPPAPAQPAAQSANEVVVNTAQGPVLRDARLEQLLAEHRQYGGMSALQMPAGFLRDATYPADPQR